MLCSGHRVGGDCEDAQPDKPWTHNPECLHWRALELVDDLRERIASLEAELREAKDLATSLLRECEQYASTIKDVFSHDHLDGRIKAEARADQAERERDEVLRRVYFGDSYNTFNTVEEAAQFRRELYSKGLETIRELTAERGAAIERIAQLEEEHAEWHKVKNKTIRELRRELNEWRAKSVDRLYCDHCHAILLSDLSCPVCVRSDNIRELRELLSRWKQKADAGDPKDGCWEDGNTGERMWKANVPHELYFETEANLRAAGEASEQGEANP